MNAASKRQGKAVHRDDLLVELGVEELPPGSLRSLGEDFAVGLARALAEAGVFEVGPGQQSYFATPRRLTALLLNVAAKQPDRVVERRGPSLQAANDSDNQPTPAALGFAKSCGVEVAQLITVQTERGTHLAHRQKVAGALLADILTECLAEVLRRLSTPRRMRWGEGEAEFVRPAHWLLALHGERVVKTEALGLRAEDTTRGHRFYAPGLLVISDTESYAELLENEGCVIPNFLKRREKIEAQLLCLASKANARVEVKSGAGKELLNLVTGMVEWPAAVLGKFDKRFLDLPDEVLISAMASHQKYFHLTNAKGWLLPRFIAVTNIAAKSPARVRRGNERVLRARLSDAEFFWHSDLKKSLAERVKELKDVLFHHKLGSLHAKTMRVVQLAERIAGNLGVDHIGDAGRAALLCKADLVTDMVGEFPDLQGVIGRYYSQMWGETGKTEREKAIADAIEQHYWPRHAGDQLPRGAVAQCVALADRIDTLVGIFASGEIPSGDKDPFALRRAALGILRILIEKKRNLDLYCLLQAGVEGYQPATAGPGLVGVTVTPDEKTVEQVFEFIYERLKAYYQPQGYSADELASVLACAPHKPLDFDMRLRALSKFFKSRPAAAESLAAANKRIAGILAKSTTGEDHAPSYNESLLRDPAEIDLARHVKETDILAREYFGEGQYDHGFTKLAGLKEPIDRFFDEVLVMDDDPSVRNNRLALLNVIRHLFLEAADISLMRVEE